MLPTAWHQARSSTSRDRARTGDPGSGLIDTDNPGHLATTIGQVQVLVNGTPAPMVYASNTQVSAIVPYEVEGFPTATWQFRFLGQTSSPVTLNTVATAPGVFTANATGTGPGAILNADLP